MNQSLQKRTRTSENGAKCKKLAKRRGQTDIGLCPLQKIHLADSWRTRNNNRKMGPI